jgi:hypothetical protein
VQQQHCQDVRRTVELMTSEVAAHGALSGQLLLCQVLFSLQRSLLALCLQRSRHSSFACGAPAELLCVLNCSINSSKHDAATHAQVTGA